MSKETRSIKRYPPVKISGHDAHLHIFRGEDDAMWEVWLNPTGEACEGLCIGCGRTRDEALANTMELVEGLEELLQAPPPEVVDTLRKGTA